MKDDQELHCAVRPDRTTVWLPLWLLRKVGAKRGVPLTPDQFSDADIQHILAARRAKEKTPKSAE